MKMTMYSELGAPRQPSGRGIYRVLAVLTAVMIFVAFVLFLPILFESPNQGSASLVSFDWSGYCVSSDVNNPQPLVTAINGSWTVPTVTVSDVDSFSATWIGIGGQFDQTLIQTGTEQDSVGGQANYSAWYELLPNDSISIDSLTVSPGDKITASIKLADSSTNTWSIEIHDLTNGQVYQKNVVYDSAMLSGEWIVERPTVNSQISPLANFGQVTFTDCSAIIDSANGTIKSFPSTQVTMVNRQNTELANVTPLTSDGKSVTVDYLD